MDLKGYSQTGISFLNKMTGRPELFVRMRFNPAGSAEIRGITSTFHWWHKQNWGSGLTENKTNAALFESKVTQEKHLGRNIPIKKKNLGKIKETVMA